jgi:1-acyl-sn-glycerol-3-phosphate acyltransferase
MSEPVGIDKTQLFFDSAKKMMAVSNMHEDNEISPDNVYQLAHKENRDMLLNVIRAGHLDGSTVLGVENMIELYKLAKEGHSCILLSEHVSNLDVPSMFTRFHDHENELMKEIFEHFIFIAGLKLNENPLVKLFTEMFTRVVIYPIRSIQKIQGETEEHHRQQLTLAKKINIRATRTMGQLRTQGNIFVMYPAGTRYRPWNPETKKGIKGTTSYLQSFDYFCCCSINGNNMLPEKHEDMTNETYKTDVITFNVGKVQHTKDYIVEKTHGHPHMKRADKDEYKQIVVDAIMDDIDLLHDEAEVYRKKLFTT